MEKAVYEIENANQLAKDIAVGKVPAPLGKSHIHEYFHKY